MDIMENPVKRAAGACNVLGRSIGTVSKPLSPTTLMLFPEKHPARQGVIKKADLKFDHR
jgi:hypothetical protein